jgi:drug/metabolite transporter (DMT)-like permease
VQNSNIRAAMLIMLAMSMITTNDAIVKHLTQTFGVGQIMFIRGVLVCAIFSVVLIATKSPVFSRHAFHRWNLVRALLELFATLAFLSGLSMLSLAVASTLAFSSPIILAVLGAVFLRERVGWLRWSMIFAGFVGVMMIANPFADSANWAVILPILCAVFVALRDLVIRYVPVEIPSLQIAFTNGGIVMLGGGLLSYYQGWSPVEVSWYGWFSGLAIAMSCGYLFSVVGTRLGELSFIAPFKYTSVLLAIAIGYIVWGEAPTLLMLGGAGIIVFSGIVLMLGESRRFRQSLAKQSGRFRRTSPL